MLNRDRQLRTYFYGTIGLSLVLHALWVDASHAATFAVTTNADSGAGSFRQAILDANGAGGADVVDCQITTATPIVLATGLPAITETVSIDGAGCVLDGNDNGDDIITVSTNNVTISDLVLGNATGVGILIDSSASNVVVQGCHIGVAADGTTAFTIEDDGILINNPTFVTIGSTSAISAIPTSCGVGTDCNIIGHTDATPDNNNADGIEIRGGSTADVTIAGNFLGADSSGNVGARIDGRGIRIQDDGSAKDRISVKYNVIGSAQFQGVLIASVDVTDVTGNHIGVGLDGNTAIGNGSNGISIDSDTTSSVTVIDNVISGNLRGIHHAAGIFGRDLSSAGDVTIRGNIIGLNASGSTAVANTSVGMILNGAADVTGAVVIGGSTAAHRNIVAGNSGSGIEISGVRDLSIDGNYVGTDSTGLIARANTIYGIYLEDTTQVRSFTNNVVAASGNDGIHFDEEDITGIGGAGNAITLTGNSIGVGVDGSTDLGNTGHGFYADNTKDLILGDPSNASLANIIAYNNGDGISLVSGATAHIHQNSFFSNTGLAIDLSNDSRTLNDNNDADSGPNNLLNVPVITRVIEQSGRLFQIDGFLPNGADGLDIYINTEKHSSGYGEGRTFLERLAVTPAGGASYSGSNLGSDSNATQFSVTTTVAAPVGTRPGLLSFLTQDSTNEVTSEFGGFEDPDTDGDGIVDNDDEDADGDGLLNTDENASGLDPLADDDTDMIPDYLDVDFASNAGCPDVGADNICDTIVALWDHDQDSAPDFIDLDSDNDSLPDVAEAGHGCTDTTPADGMCDGLVGANGFVDVLETAVDSGVATLANLLNTDNITDEDLYDLNSDEDTELDIDEVGNDGLDADDDGVLDDGETGSITDADRDGISASADDNDNVFGFPALTLADIKAIDADSDQIPDHVDSSTNSPGDTDADGLPDPLECASGWPCPDSDADGVPNYVVANPVDTDGDGINDIVDVDDDNDGILDTAENADALNPNADADNDGIPNHLDPQATSPACTDTTPADGVCDAPSSTFDVDGDGIANHLDIDSDGDGINDLVEMGLGPDADDDGEIDGGVGGTGAPTTITNSGIDTDPDGDGDPNFADTDSDGDGTSDAVETAGGVDTDTDGDGVPDYLDSANSDPCSPDDMNSVCTADADSDGTPDHIDSDDTDPCVPSDTVSACTADADSDGTPDHLDSDDSDPCVPNTDASACDNDDDDDDADPNRDTDGDGLSDVVEEQAGTDPNNALRATGGGMCAGSGGSLDLMMWVMCLGLLVTMRGRRRRWVESWSVGAMLWVGLWGVGVADAQTADLARNWDGNRLRPALTHKGIINVESATVGEPGNWDFQLLYNYEEDPFILTEGGPELRLLASRHDAHLSFSAAVTRWLSLGVDIPVIADQARAANTAAIFGDIEASGIGDVAITPKIQFVGKDPEDFSVALILRGTIATATPRSAYLGETLSTGLGELALSKDWGGFGFAFNTGAMFREVQPQRQNGLEIEHELIHRLGVKYDTGLVRFDVAAEHFTNLERPYADGEDNTTGGEVLASLGFRLSEGASVYVGGAVPFDVAYGVPSYRAFAGLRLFRANVDKDKDGIKNSDDQCPELPEDLDEFEDADGCPELDNDGDKIEDALDAAPNAPEDLDGFEDEDGAPDPDNDNDTVLDGDDACPMEAEDKDGFQDEDGCPDLDNDGDGIADADDGDPNAPEDLDGFEDADGIPDLDNDGDGVADNVDNCPLVAGTAQNQGCKRKQRVVIRGCNIELKEKVFFKPGKARIKKRSFALVDNIAQVLVSQTQLKSIRIEGHTDGDGPAPNNLRLSQKRAEAVRRYLIQKKVSPERLVAVGFGETRPIDSNKTRAGKANNRRVELHIEDCKEETQEVEIE